MAAAIPEALGAAEAAASAGSAGSAAAGSLGQIVSPEQRKAALLALGVVLIWVAGLLLWVAFIAGRRLQPAGSQAFATESGPELLRDVVTGQAGQEGGQA